MCAPLIVVGVMMVAAAAMAAKSASDQANAQKAAANEQSQVAQQNANIASQQAAQAITQGQTDEQNQELKNANLVGQQRAAMAANGIDISSDGSATDVLASTKWLGQKDVLTIHDNALRSAWGFENQGASAQNQADFYKSAADNIDPAMAATSAGISSASSVASKWYTGSSVGALGGSSVDSGASLNVGSGGPSGNG